MASIELSQIAFGVGGFVINGEFVGDSSSFSVSNAGDVNGDGLADLIIGAPYGSDTGKSYVVFGKVNGNAVNLSQVATGVGGFVISGGTVGGTAGFSVSNAGDVNGDGLADLIIVAVSASLNGRSYVVFGKTSGAAVNLSQIAIGTGGFIIDSEYPDEFSNNNYGFSVSDAGDVNGDGLADLIIGAPNASDSGKSYVVFGKANRTAINLSQIVAGVGGFVIQGEAGGDNAGFSVSGAGDVNGDGLADLIIGAPNASSSSKGQAGKSYVVFGKASGTEVELSQVATGLGGFVINGEANNDFSGTTVSRAGDVNNDGFADLLVSAVFAARGNIPGKSYVVFGGNFTTNTARQLGDVGNDILTGTANFQVLMGVQGDDQINDGGFNNLKIYGGSGDDLIRISNSNVQYIDGGSGRDTIEASVNFSLVNTANVERLKLTGNATQGTGNALDNFLLGNNFNDTLSGGDGDDTLSGAGGANTLIGGQGNDTYYIQSANDVIVEEAQGGTDYVYSFVDFRLANTSYVEVLYLVGNAVRGTGNTLNNALWGNDRNNILDGGNGNDFLRGLGGADKLIGGKGNDIYFLDDPIDDIVVEQADGGIDTIQVEADFSLENLAYVERLVLGYGAIVGAGNALDNEIIGNDFNNMISGGSGNDTLYGNEGDDSLQGGSGNDILNGGAGNDTYYVDSTNDVVVEATNGGTDTINATIDFSLTNLANIENLQLNGSSVQGTGNALSNIITGNAQNNILNGGAGDDTLSGGAGNDLLITGMGSDYLDGGEGNDQLIVEYGEGVDTLVGGLGDDYYAINIASLAVVVEQAGQGTDTVGTLLDMDLNQLKDAAGNVADIENLITAIPTNSSLVLKGNSLNNVIVASNGNDTLYGNAGNDTLAGGAGNDLLVTGMGSDYLDGGEGNDQLIVEYSEGVDTLIGGLGDDYYGINFAELAVVIEEVSQGTDTVGTLLDMNLNQLKDSAGNVADIENLITAIPTNSSLVLKGNSLNNAIVGSNGNDTLYGYAGDDTLTGGMGNDTLIGGGGTDTLVGGNGSDSFSLNQPGQGVVSIADFGDGADQCVVSASAFGGGLIPGTALSATQLLVGSDVTAPTSTSQRFVYNMTTGALFFDADGNQGGFATMQIATFMNRAAISTSSISVMG
ncbi:FG-GAP repeat protein [Phormidium tenue FACHB-886]|nr:FG-GAP repeat protein [Phormidium tenue FACHB-886]